MDVNLDEHTVQITPTVHRWRSMMFWFRHRGKNDAINEMVQARMWNGTELQAIT